MKKWIQSISRYILSMALLYGIYTETGFWTTLAMLFIIINSELLGVYIHKNTELMKTLFGGKQ